MTERKQALLVFSKPPIPGMVKTRLTKAHGGIFTDEQAAQFFKLSLYDVSELAMHALIELQRDNDALVAADPTADKITYDFFISTTPAENLPLMKETFDAIGPWPMEIHFLTDSGATFDDHFDDAIAQIFAMGYDNIVSIGGDIPTLPKSDLKYAFQWLEYFQSIGRPGFVLAPCQECGTSLIGLSKDTPIDNQGVYYNKTMFAENGWEVQDRGGGHPGGLLLPGGRHRRDHRPRPCHLLHEGHPQGGPVPIRALRAESGAHLVRSHGHQRIHTAQ